MKSLLTILCLGVAIQVSLAEQKKAASKAQAAPAAAVLTSFSGKVAETMNTAGYTYVLIDDGKQKLWAAAMQFDVKKGDTVAVNGAMPMDHYHSKTLNRDFDVVYFVTDVQVNGKSTKAEAVEQLPPGHPPIDSNNSSLPKGHPDISGAKPTDKADACCIKKATGGKTVAEIQADKRKLKGQPITVRGKVVKYNGGILGKNWMHIEDGSGTAGNGRLVITTDTTAKVGDTVLVTGNVSTDRDFGAGYKYDVIVENAKVTVE